MRFPCHASVLTHFFPSDLETLKNTMLFFDRWKPSFSLLHHHFLLFFCIMEKLCTFSVLGPYSVRYFCTWMRHIVWSTIEDGIKWVYNHLHWMKPYIFAYTFCTRVLWHMQGEEDSDMFLHRLIKNHFNHCYKDFNTVTCMLL